jgi:hypothetical protein
VGVTTAGIRWRAATTATQSPRCTSQHLARGLQCRAAIELGLEQLTAVSTARGRPAQLTREILVICHGRSWLRLPCVHTHCVIGPYRARVGEPRGAGAAAQRAHGGGRAAAGRPHGAARNGRGGVSRAFLSYTRSILTEIYLCHACSDREFEDGNARAGCTAWRPRPAASWRPRAPR